MWKAVINLPGVAAICCVSGLIIARSTDSSAGLLLLPVAVWAANAWVLASAFPVWWNIGRAARLCRVAVVLITALEFSFALALASWSESI
jgi:hypothetical protein